VADPAMLAAPHPGHDVVRIAAAADRADGPLPTLTQALLAACTECARLHADLLALAAALPSAATPRRTRDFTLTAADAERLRPRGLRRWLGLVGTSRDTITRPLAIGFTTLGLVGLLLTTVPTALPMGGAGAAPAGAEPQEAAASGAAAAPSAAPSSIALSMSAEPSPVDDGEVFNGSDSSDPAPAAATPPPGDIAATPEIEAAAPEDPAGLSTLAIIAGSLLIVGLGAFALRWTARRLGDG
jgi:anti-sigma factor RsiW